MLHSSHFHTENGSIVSGLVLYKNTCVYTYLLSARVCISHGSLPLFQRQIEKCSKLKYSSTVGGGKRKINVCVCIDKRREIVKRSMV